MRASVNTLSVAFLTFGLAASGPALGQTPPDFGVPGLGVIRPPTVPVPPILIGTDRGTIAGSATEFNGTPFTVRFENGVTVLTFAGDFVVPDGKRVIGRGANAASLRAANNALIGEGVVFDFSASGRQAGPGGGAGGDGSNGGAGGAGEGVIPLVYQPGAGGAGQVIFCVAGICGETASARPGESPYLFKQYPGVAQAIAQVPVALGPRAAQVGPPSPR